MVKLRMKNTNHHCEALAIFCIDFRFWKKTLNFIKEKLKIKSFDVLALAGGAKNLASPKEEIYRKIVIENLKISISLHKIKKIILVNHEDCGAYGGSKRFESLEKEISFHKKELLKAKKILKRIFPNQTIFAFFVGKKKILES